MQRRSLVLPAICASVFALVLATDCTAAAPGAADCLAAPNRAPEEGQHWYFRTDRETNQKCWYLRDRDVATTGAVAGQSGATAQPSPPSDTQPSAAQPAETSPPSARAEKALFRDFLRWYKERGGAQ